MSEKLRIILLDTKSSNPNHYIYLSIAAALRRHPDVDSVLLGDYGNALSLAVENDANFLLAYDGENLNTEICRRLRNRCGFAALWVTDDPYERTYNLDSADVFDLVFTNDEASVEAYGSKGHFLSLGGDPETHFAPVRKEGDPGLRYDVFFAGVAWPNRVRLLRSLLRDLPDVRFKIALVGNEHLPAFDLPMPRGAYSYRVAPREFARLANASRMTLGLDRNFSATPRADSHTISPPPRLFEAAFAGSVQVVSDTMKGLDRAFEPVREIATFHEYRDCMSTIVALLSDPQKRTATALAAQQRAAREHSYDARVATLLARCASAPRASLRRSVHVPDRPRVLLVSHNVIGEGPHGGVEIYIERLRRWLARDVDVFTYSYASAKGENAFILIGPRGETLERIVFDGLWQRFSLSNPVKEEQFAALLARHRISLVHYHHLIGHPLSLPIVSRALGLPAIWTLHDYFGICDSFDLLDYDQRYCGIEHRSERVCDYCTWRRVGLADGAQRARRTLVGRSLDAVDAILVSGNATRERYAKFFPEAMAGPKTRELPIPMPENITSYASGAPKRFTDGAPIPLELIALGNFSVEKGALVILDAARALAAERVRFRIYGRVDRDVRVRAGELSLPNVTFEGEYRSIDLATILESADCTLHLSIWPETYCIALSEAWAHRRIPIVSNIGALGERVRDGINGIHVSPNDAGDLVRIIREIIAAPAMIATMSENIEPDLWPEAHAHARAIAGLYRELIGERPIDTRAGNGLKRTALTLFDCGIALERLSLGDYDHLDAREVLSRPAEAEDAVRGHAGLDRVGALALPAEPGLHAHLDGIDGRPQSDATVVAKADDETLELRGWRVDRTSAKPLGAARILLVDCDDGQAYAAATVREERPDLVTAFGSAAVTDAGFAARVPLGGVRPGTYRLALADEDRIAVFEGVSVVVRARLEEEPSFANVVRGAVLVNAAIRSINGAPVAGSAQPVPINGRLACSGSLGGPVDACLDDVWLVLESTLDGVRRFAKTRLADPDGADARAFHVELDVSRIPAGVYNLSIALDDVRQMLASEPLVAVRLGELS